MRRPQPAYRVLDAANVPPFIASVEGMSARLGGSPGQWQVREVGDGNLNLVFLVDGPAGSVCLKQALPYVRAAGPSWPMSTQRAFFEHAYFSAVAPAVGDLIPGIYHHDPALQCTIMQRLSPHIILRQGLIAARHYANAARDIGEYIARACFFTSDLAVPFEHKLAQVALFARNEPMIRITVDLIFAEPYFAAARNRHTSPQLDGHAAAIRNDGALKAGAAHFGYKFLTEAQALLHGDLHSGSVMVTEHDTRVIDPEFAFYGPIGFDLGAFLGNLLLNYYAQFGHETTPGDRAAYREWLLSQAQVFWQTFRDRFLALWTERARGDAYPGVLFAEADHGALRNARGAFMDGLFQDMLGFAACKMIRRILGFAHVPDLETIADDGRRARCEAAALALATRLLRGPDRFASLDHVSEAVRAESVESY